MKKFDYVVYIGRFQPPHFGHIKTIETALSLSDKVIILIGTANQPRTIKNPFTWHERADMIKAYFSDNNQVVCKPIEDAVYNNQVWARWVQTEVDQVIAEDVWSANPSERKIGIIGHVKDGSSFYLKMFPQWEFIQVENHCGINSTDIREDLFTNVQQVFNKHARSTIPTQIADWLCDFIIDHEPEFSTLVKEHEFIKTYKQAWKDAPYPPTFVTVDAVVIQSGHVLMIHRGAHPGLGLLALPGGFVNQDETLETAMLRELREETKLKVPEPVLRGSIVSSKVFDNPNRSLRGRTITNAYLIELAPGELPKVKGGDDAKKAMWIPLAELGKMKNQCFEDHYVIVNHFLGRI